MVVRGHCLPPPHCFLPRLDEVEEEEEGDAHTVRCHRLAAAADVILSSCLASFALSTRLAVVVVPAATATWVVVVWMDEAMGLYSLS